MGFLEQSSNNIIVDAVLTDLGRQFLAKNDGSFSIVKFACGDEEVDFTLIQQFGRTVGKEKIEKNTPVFEALTNQNYAQKYRSISISNPNLIRIPNLTLTGEGVDTAGALVSIGNTTTKTRAILVSQDCQNETSIDNELQDQAFIIQMDNKFLQVLNTSADNIDGQNEATYIIKRDTNLTAIGGTKITLTISTKAILETQFQIYGSRADKNVINTYVRVSGINSGTVKEFTVQITKTA
jgi:predicted HNH restriction endonuclease